MLPSKTCLFPALALISFAVSASADPVLYVSDGFQLGTIDAATGAFQQIGTAASVGGMGLVPGPNGSLLTLSFSGNLVSINPANGLNTAIGPTGLGNCVTPTSPCGPNSPNTIGELGGKLFATDFQNRLYSLNSVTGAATAIGLTGIPALPFTPLSTNPDGTINIYDEALFATGGKLYASFDAAKLNPATSAITPVIDPDLYQIDTATGHAKLIAPTVLGLSGATEVGGTTYVFNIPMGQIDTLDLANGNATFFSNYDSTAGIVTGASPVPEPASIALTVAGIMLLFIFQKTKKGPNTPEFTFGLVPGPNGSLLTLGGSGKLDSINPATGVTTVIGLTGLADCSIPTDPTCGPMAANVIGELGGTVYATDLGNNLYKVNPVTGAASLVGPTGIPAVPAVPDSINPDGTKNAFDEILFGSNAKLYAPFEAIKINPEFRN